MKIKSVGVLLLIVSLGHLTHTCELNEQEIKKIKALELGTISSLQSRTKDNQVSGEKSIERRLINLDKKGLSEEEIKGISQFVQKENQEKFVELTKIKDKEYGVDQHIVAESKSTLCKFDRGEQRQKQKEYIKIITQKIRTQVLGTSLMILFFFTKEVL